MINLKDRYDRYFLALSLILYIPAFTVAIFYALTNFNGTKFVRSLSNSDLQAANELGHNFDDHCSYFCFLTKRTTLSFIEILKHAKKYIHPVTLSHPAQYLNFQLAPFYMEWNTKFKVNSYLDSKATKNGILICMKLS